jgi:U3 small nucleolar RNA-associated protein 14
VVKEKTKGSVRFADVDLNEDEDLAPQDSEQDEAGDEEDEEESGEDDEFINVLDILDGRGEPLSDDEDAPPTLPQQRPVSPVEESDEEMDKEEEDEDDRISISLSDAENEAVGALDDLQTFISSLDPTSSSTKKRKASGEEPEQPKKRRTIKERTEAGTESEFRTQSAGNVIHNLFPTLLFMRHKAYP